MCNVSWVYRMKGGARVESCCPALQHKMMTLLGVIRIVRQAGMATNMVAAAQYTRLRNWQSTQA